MNVLSRTLSKLDLRVEQFLGDFGVNYRIIQGPHGWLDLLAGFRYQQNDFLYRVSMQGAELTLGINF